MVSAGGAARRRCGCESTPPTGSPWRSTCRLRSSSPRRQLEMRDPVAQLGASTRSAVESIAMKRSRWILASAARPIANDAARPAHRRGDWAARTSQKCCSCPACIRRCRRARCLCRRSLEVMMDTARRLLRDNVTKVHRRGFRRIATCASSARRPGTTRACGSTAAATSPVASAPHRSP